MNQSAPVGGPMAQGSSNPFVRRLRALTGLDEADLAALERLCGEPRRVRPRVELIGDGDRPARLHVLLDGWACRIRLLADGKRQITALLIPGDICDLSALHLHPSDYAATTLTSCTVSAIDREALRALNAANPAVADALGWLGAVENAMLAERIACIGRRSARHHLAHFLCELFLRLKLVGHAGDGGFALPITQEEIGDALGLTPVHVNRVLQGLRREGLIAQRGRHLAIRDWDALRREAGFRPDYLHLEGARHEGGAAARSLRGLAVSPATAAVGAARA